jgi:hypothetical protein
MVNRDGRDVAKTGLGETIPLISYPFQLINSAQRTLRRQESS